MRVWKGMAVLMLAAVVAFGCADPDVKTDAVAGKPSEKETSRAAKEEIQRHFEKLESSASSKRKESEREPGEERNDRDPKQKTLPPQSPQRVDRPSTKRDRSMGGKPHRTVFHHGPRSDKEVALTFDDGPDGRYTPEILDILKRKKVRATFYLVGMEAKRHPRVVKRIHREGHVIANHTWNHPDLTLLGSHALESQIRKTDRLLKRLTGTEPLLMRPPYGKLLPHQAEQIGKQGRIITYWDVDTRDWSGVHPDSLVDTVKRHTRSGSIILLHSGGGDRGNTVRALPRLIDQLQAKGYRLVTVPELLGVPAVKSTESRDPVRLMKKQPER